MGELHPLLRVFRQPLPPLSYYLRLFGLIAVKYTGSENGSCKNGAYLPFTRIHCAHSVQGSDLCHCAQPCGRF